MIHSEKSFYSFWNQPIREKTFLVLISLTFLPLIVMLLLKSCWDTDTLWLVATGREILEGGISYENPFSIDESFAIVIQQWLFCVITALFDRLGYIGYWLFGILNVLFLAVITWKYFSYHVGNRFLVFAAVFLLIALFRASVATPRPEGVTVALLLLECLALERYAASHQSGWLALLPVTMALEANLHSSMVWFHFAILLAYVTPVVPKGLCADNGIREGKKAPLIFWSLSMVPAMFLNPYGADGAFYLFASMGAGTFRHISISETALPAITSKTTLFILLSVLLAWFAHKTGQLKNHQVYMAAGFSLLSCLMIRNIMFLYVSVALLLVPFLKKLEGFRPDLRSGLKRSLVLLFAVLYLYAGVGAAGCVMAAVNSYDGDLTKMAAGEVAGDEVLYDMYCYMQERSGKEVSDLVLFAGFHNGAYFEYAGFKHVFMDARPELLMKALNGCTDLLVTYSSCCTSYSGNYTHEGKVADEIRDLLDTYDFDYLVVEKSYETQLLSYLETADTESGYVKVMESDDNILYERISQE